jgi:lipoprotein NlpI
MKRVFAACAFTLLLGGAARADGYQDFNLGLAAQQHQDWDSAMAYFSRALSDPAFPQHLRAAAYFDRGLDYTQKNQIDLALADINAAIQLKPDSVFGYTERGLIYASKSQFPQAIADLTKAIDLRPKYRRTYIYRIETYSAMKDENDAIADCTTLIGIDPTDTSALVLRAQYYRRFGKFDLAIADATSSIQAATFRPEGYEERGFDYAEERDYAKAIDDFDAESHHLADPSFALMRKGAAQWDAGNFQAADDTFVSVLQRQPLQEYGYLWLAVAAAKAGTPVPPDVTARFTSADLTKWPGPLVAFYLGKSAVADVYAGLSKVDPLQQPLEKCTADFFVGEWQNLHGGPPSEKLKSVTQSCAFSGLYHTSAVAESDRMTASNRPASP